MAICNWCGDEDTTDVWKSHICIEDKEEGQISKELKEINEALTNLWWNAEISDNAKLWWNDHYQQLMERELAK